MIPKIIHYCWFGGNPLPDLAQKCIASWKKYLSDYEIKEWNESNFDINSNVYVKEAYEARKFAFVTDYVRLYAMYHEGGIYMDTDVEVIKPLDGLLKYEAVSGFESPTQIPTGLMACRKGYHFFKELLDDYSDIHFIRPDGSFDLTTNVTRITEHCLKYGLKQNNILQTINGFTLLPKDYLCPKSYQDGKIYLTENSYTIHHFAGSWVGQEEIQSKILSDKLKGLIPFHGYVAKFIILCKYRGIKKAFYSLYIYFRSKIHDNEGL